MIAFEAEGPQSRPLKRLFRELARRPGAGITSELTIAELLAPARRDQVMSVSDRQRLYLRLFDDEGFIGLAAVTRSILMDTTRLRETFPQRIPDAIHVATAMDHRCNHFVSFDRDARRTPPSLDWIAPTDDNVDRCLNALDA